MGRTASGVRWIKLSDIDKVVNVTIVKEDDEYVMVVSEKWMWKLTKIDEYRSQNRGWSWVKTMAMSDKTGKLVWAMTLTVEEKQTSDVLLISKAGQTIRLPIKWIRATSRVTQWVILTKLKEAGDTIVNASKVKQSEEDYDI
jgi:DNA gyrase subunit A